MFSEKTKELSVEMKAKEASLRMAAFISENNLSFKLMEHLPNSMRSCSSDSDIAKQIQCGPTKIKSVITNVTGESERQRIIDLMKNSKFSIIADESIDCSCVKNLALIAGINCSNEQMKDYFLALIPVQEATGLALFDHIKIELVLHQTVQII
ncbi:unnamed protein product [Callosobruchus maculatus]|uniref:DUF4371 domain-containing protein n=1 Tax=Callosobruchus maculatus TaxID=64391 RepID=A0A653BNL8_CALMS|nr:unnamed protein product [Callosobruchus maculatus]